MNLNQKLNSCFASRVVRKDLTKIIKEGAKVPVMYCATDDEGVDRVKKYLHIITFDQMKQKRLRVWVIGLCSGSLKNPVQS